MVPTEAIKQKLREAEQSVPAQGAQVVSEIKRPAVQSSDTKAPPPGRLLSEDRKRLPDDEQSPSSSRTSDVRPCHAHLRM